MNPETAPPLPPVELHSVPRPLPTAPKPMVVTPKPFILSDPLTSNSQLPPIDDADRLLEDEKLAAPPEIVAGVLHKGTKGVVASCSKAGKTWLLLDLAMSVATGTPVMNWNTTAGKVLFVNFEIPRYFMKMRIQSLKQKKGTLSLTNLKIWTLRGLGADFDSLTEKMIRLVKDGKRLIQFSRFKPATDFKLAVSAELVSTTAPTA